MARLTSSTACRTWREKVPPTRKCFVRPRASSKGARESGESVRGSSTSRIELPIAHYLRIVEKAAYQIVAAGRVRAGVVLGTDVHNVWTARVKAAPTGRITKIGRAPGNAFEILFRTVDRGIGAEQSLRVGVLWLVEHLAG